MARASTCECFLEALTRTLAPQSRTDAADDDDDDHNKDNTTVRIMIREPSRPKP